MSLGSWDPDAANAASTITIDATQLATFAGWSAGDQLDDLAGLLGDDAQRLAGLMQLDADSWTSAAADLDNDTLRHLVRFFTVAETLPGWEAGEKSPVIPLAKALRQRGEKLDRELLQWIRQVSNNRYLPYGPLL